MAMGMRTDRRKDTSATAETTDRFEAAGHRQLFFWIYKNRAIHYNKEKAKGDAAMPLTHLDEQGRARMVDVGDKAYTPVSYTHLMAHYKQVDDGNPGFLSGWR